MDKQDKTYQHLKAFYESAQLDKEQAVEATIPAVNFEQCMKLALSNDQPAAWRSAWALANSVKTNPGRIISRLPEIMCRLPEIKRDGQIRELLKLFKDTAISDWPEEVQGSLFDFCMSVLQDSDKQPGTRSIGLQILLKFAAEEPLLLGEIQASFELIKHQLSKGVRMSCERRMNIMENKYLHLD